MPAGESSGYLPGDPRYGLSGDTLRRYYSEKPAQWVIFAWDGVGQAGARAAHIAAQKDYARALGERLIGYGHIVSDDASRRLRPPGSSSWTTGRPPKPLSRTIP